MQTQTEGHTEAAYCSMSLQTAINKKQFAATAVCNEWHNQGAKAYLRRQELVSDLNGCTQLIDGALQSLMLFTCLCCFGDSVS